MTTADMALEQNVEPDWKEIDTDRREQRDKLGQLFSTLGCAAVCGMGWELYDSFRCSVLELIGSFNISFSIIIVRMRNQTRYHKAACEGGMEEK
jgi:hypothetical protein